MKNLSIIFGVAFVALVFGVIAGNSVNTKATAAVEFSEAQSVDQVFQPGTEFAILWDVPEEDDIAYYVLTLTPSEATLPAVQDTILWSELETVEGGLSVSRDWKLQGVEGDTITYDIKLYAVDQSGLAGEPNNYTVNFSYYLPPQPPVMVVSLRIQLL